MIQSRNTLSSSFAIGLAFSHLLLLGCSQSARKSQGEGQPSTPLVVAGISGVFLNRSVSADDVPFKDIVGEYLVAVGTQSELASDSIQYFLLLSDDGRLWIKEAGGIDGRIRFAGPFSP